MEQVHCVCWVRWFVHCHWLDLRRYAIIQHNELNKLNKLNKHQILRWTLIHC